MDHNELSVEADKAYGKLKEQSATSKQMIADQTRQKNCNVMTKYLTDVGLSYVDVSELPMTIDGITFDVIPEQRDPHPIQSNRPMLPAYVTVLTPCRECDKDVWTSVSGGNLAQLGEVLQVDFEPRHECPAKQSDGPLSEFDDLKSDDVVTWGALTRLLKGLQQEYGSLFGGRRNG